MRIRDEAGRSRYEAFVPLRLIERNMAFSSRYAMTIIAIPTSQRSTWRMKGLVGIVFVEALIIIPVSSIEALLFRNESPAMRNALTLPYSGWNIHHRRDA